MIAPGAVIVVDSLVKRARVNISKLVVYETGKPLAGALGEVDYALGFAWCFVGEAERLRGSIAQPSVSDRRTLVIQQPIGVAAALAAGCSMIVKPSLETPLSVLVLADFAVRAAFPAGVVNVITTDNAKTPVVSEAQCKHPLVRKFTFTGSTTIGSTTIGSLVAKYCSEGLENSRPFPALMVLKWQTAGQACTHATWVYVQRGVYNKFAQMMVAVTKELRIGRDADDSMTMGALTTCGGVDKLERHIADAGGIFGPLLGLYRFDEKSGE
ncbi:Aldehyde/histidinol dehydrogenase [Xylariomycetidae sp. FL2044]|nr:Aldehyde/histidinol dehydrogenase [Xylariomycetidae sp. FL2044]